MQRPLLGAIFIVVSVVSCSPISSYNLGQMRMDCSFSSDLVGARVLNMPKFQKCGVAAISAAIQLAGGIPNKSVCNKIDESPHRGTTPIELIHAVRMSGCSSKLLTGDVEEVFARLGTGVPVVVCLGNDKGDSHYTVLVDYFEEGSLVLFEPRDVKCYRVSVDRFLLSWTRAKRFALAVKGNAQ
jgi:ABC-type bacteriocin/lantibiotic exporter with double-glycine peptidase domain